jgi:hypothetical protein
MVRSTFLASVAVAMAMLVAFLAAVAIALALLVAAPAMARPSPTSSPSPFPTATPVEDPAVTAVAKREFVAWQAGVVKRTSYTPAMQLKLTDDLIGQTARALGTLGALQSMQFLGPVDVDDAPPNSQSYMYKVNCANGSVYMQFALTPEGKVAGMLFQDKLPPQS